MSEQQIENSAAGGLVRRCWFTHDWGKWVDTYKATKESTIHGGVIGIGIQQERRCQRCNKLQIRIVLA